MTTRTLWAQSAVALLTICLAAATPVHGQSGGCTATDCGSAIGCSPSCASDCSIGCASDCSVGCASDCSVGCASDCSTGCSTGLQLSDCYCDDMCGWGHCTGVYFEFLYLQPTGVDMVHAQQQDGIGAGPGTVPFGRIGAVDPDYEPGLKAGFSIALDACSSICGSYAYFESDSVQNTFPPAIPGGVGAVGSLVHHPGTLLTASGGPVTGFYNIDFQLGDIEYRRLLRACDRYWLNYSVGLRYAHLEQEFLQMGVFGGGLAGAIDTQTGIWFDGAGLKLGLDGERLIGCRGLSVYGKTSVAPTVGQFFSRYTMTNTTTSALLAEAVWNDDRFVTLLDYEVGVAWTSCNGCLRASLGYMAQFWYNAITTPEFVDAVQADNYVDIGDTISFDGVTARLEVRF